MFDEDGGFSILGHHYRPVTALNQLVCEGDIIRFRPPLDRDAEWYMFEYRAEHKVMVLVNWLGYKAGLENKIAVIPNDAFAKGTRMVQLSWFKENWDSRFIGRGSFDEAQFFTWDGEDSV